MRIVERYSFRECHSAIEGRLWCESKIEGAANPFILDRAFIYPCRETRELLITAAKEEDAARLERIEAADARREADGRSLFSRTPFGPRMSLKNYRVKPASKAWIEANRI